MSTLAELAGFVLISVAAWMLHPVAGLAVAGAALVLIGYAMDDAQVAVSARKMLAPFRKLRRAKDL